MFGWHRHIARAAPDEPRSAGERKFDLAMAEADDLVKKTKSVKDQLEPYRTAEDPLDAIERATALDGFYPSKAAPGPSDVIVPRAPWRSVGS